MNESNPPLANEFLVNNFFFTPLGVILILCSGFLNITAQDSNYKTSFTDAEYYFLFNDFKEALPLYLKAYDQKVNSANLCYRIGMCYLNIPGLKHRSIPYLEKATQNINLSYQEGSYKEMGAPITSYYLLGEAYRIEGRFIDAIEAYNVFRGILAPRDFHNLDYVNQQISACERATEMIKSPTEINLDPIKLFNSNKFIQGAVMSYDMRTLLFTVKEKFYDAVYISVKRENGVWSIPENISLYLGLEGELFTTSINYDGTELFLFKIENGTGNIYSSKIVNGVWQKAQRLGRPLNSRFWETHASISPDGNTLFFASNRRGGYGGLDIYYSKRLSNGEWGEAINIGPSINTSYNEEAPHLSPDGKKLFFISQGHNTLGGYDVFYSELVGENEWSAPINMGYPISTTDDDMWFFPLGTDTGLVSIVERDKPNHSNLFTLSIANEPKTVEVKIRGEIVLSNNYEVQGDLFNVFIVDALTNDTLTKTNPEGLTGHFELLTKPGSYRIVAQGSGYTSATIPVVIPSTFAQDYYSMSIKLTPDEVTSGKYLVVKSILFGFDSDKLDRDALFELEKLYNILEQNPDLSIEVTGHTDNLGSAAYNQKLSLRRAQSIVNYLIEKGIEKNQVKARGASAHESIASNFMPDGSDNPAGRSLNRRASIRILSSDLGMVIEDELEVPDHLKPRDQKYTIRLAPVNSSVNEKHLTDLKNYSGFDGLKLVGKNKQFVFTVGEFNNKSAAISLLNYAIDNGFPLAIITGVDDLNMLIGRLTPK